jgi:hypothetical protein
MKQNKQSSPQVSNEWPETEPATSTNNYPNPTTNPNTTTNPNSTQTQSLRTFSKDDIPLTFKYPSSIGEIFSQKHVMDGNYAVYASSGDKISIQLMGIGFPDYNEIEVRDADAYTMTKTRYNGSEFIGADGRTYFVAYGLQGQICGDMGIICQPKMIGVKKLAGNNYGFVNAFLMADSNHMTIEDFKKIIESVSILNLPPPPENAPPAFVQPGFLSYPSPTVTFNHTSSFQGELKDLYEQRLGDDFLDMAPNFASYYRIGVVGCGTSCWGHVVIDLRDGKYYKVPDGSGNAFSSQANSKLFIGVNVPNYTDYPDQALVVELEAKNREAKVKWYSFSESTKSFTYITTGYCNIMEGTNGASATVTNCIEQ